MTQILLLLAALLAIVYLLLPAERKASLRVYIDKNFLRFRYNYRSEWLRIIQTLATDLDGLPLRVRCIKALGQIVGSSSGALWVLDSESSSFKPYGAWNCDSPSASISGAASLTEFLRSTNWIIDIREYRAKPRHYEPLEFDPDGLEVDGATFVIPLFHQSELMGIVVLGKPEKSRSLNYEDHDLLKTSGYQIASYLSQELLTEELAQGRQFEAFNRLTAFLMHDLKNVMAQQSLVLSNAKKYRDNADFVDDALLTIEHSVARMQKVLDQLAQRAPDLKAVRVNVNSAFLKAVSACDDRKPVPTISDTDTVRVVVDPDKFQMSLNHLIRNAQDATDADGSIALSAQANGKYVVVSVTDTGRGMTPAFVRERLFRPFDSTKGVQGMGIGAYQVREFCRLSGGDLQVTSEPGTGTEIAMKLPAIE